MLHEVADATSTEWGAPATELATQSAWMRGLPATALGTHAGCSPR